MYPPIFEIATRSPAVLAALGESPTRLYLFGLAPQGTSAAYAVWQVVGGQPENYLGDRPNIDRFAIQMDVYGDSATAVRAAVKALRDALEDHAHVTAWRGESRDPETKRYRSSFDLDFWTPR